jgi:hypothetical protein
LWESLSCATILDLPRHDSLKRDRLNLPLRMMKHLAAGLFATLVAVSPAAAEEQSKCAAAPPVLWGDGQHDDTAALNVWFRGETVLWAQTHQAVGSEIIDHDFLLSSTIYIQGGTGRRLERFRMVWPHRDEIVSGGTITTGSDPDGQPVADGITKVNADPDEGVPYDGDEAEPTEHGIPRHCLTS